LESYFLPQEKRRGRLGRHDSRLPSANSIGGFGGHFKGNAQLP
jgi:hypothetical protein